jgi:hypothetical protein
MKALKRLWLTTALLTMAPALLSCATGRSANDEPLKFDATVKMTGGLVAVGLGYGWGHGTVSYQGTEQAFCVRGLSVGDFALANLKAQGLVFHLNSLSDFSGRYFAMSTGVAVARGESAAILKNEHGVTMQLETAVRGLRFNLAASSLRIILAGQQGCSNPQTASR